MMAVKYKTNMATAFILFIVINMAKSHIEPSSDDTSDDGDPPDMDRRSARRYNGLSIEITHFNGTNMNVSDKTSTSEQLNQRRNMDKVKPNKPSNIENMNNDKISPPVHALKIETTREATTTRAVYPPLNRRYRRIYNPDEVASIEEYPFVAALLVNNELWCGGVIIDKDKVLTAAHCLQLQYNNRFFREYVKMLTVRVGSTNATAGGELLRVAEIFFHPNYKPQTLEFNFAVIKLHRNLTFGLKDSFIESIPYTENKVVPVDDQITFLGWGSVLGITGSGGQVLLQQVKLPVYDISDCQEIYGRDLVTRTNFCAGYITIPKNVCNHDAGGPAIMDGVLIGILSFSSKRCDQADQPAVFSIVGVVEPWLSNLGNKRVQLLNTAIKAQEMVAKE